MGESKVVFNSGVNWTKEIETRTEFGCNQVELVGLKTATGMNETRRDAMNGQSQATESRLGFNNTNNFETVPIFFSLFSFLFCNDLCLHTNGLSTATDCYSLVSVG